MFESAYLLIFFALIFMDDFNLVEFIILQQNRFRDNQCGCDANFIQKRRDEFQAELVSLVRKFIHQSLHKIIDPVLTQMFSLETHAMTVIHAVTESCYVPPSGAADPAPDPRTGLHLLPPHWSPPPPPGRSCSGSRHHSSTGGAVLLSFRPDSVVTIKRCGACRRGCNWEFIHFIAACVVMA